ncbi:sodium:proton antiporter [Rosistilla oblonga]|uniref:sodium:proton antiporter n=1 Tax=Rosistilla oblonga TaxID=2527990 RepID=UPI003A969CAD
MEQVVGLYNYWVVIFLMMTGFYMVIARRNLMKSIIGLNIFQTSVFLLYITMGKIHGGTAPIVPPRIVQNHAHDGHADGEAAGHAASHAASHAAEVAHAAGKSVEEVIEAGARMSGEVDGIIYSNPLPSVLMLTAIVVGIATTALALSLIVRIREDYGTIDEEKILEMDRLP